MLRTLRKLPFLEFFGLFLVFVGFCFAIIGVGEALDDEHAALTAKPGILKAVEEMRIKLVEAKVPEEQIPGLLRVHKSAVVQAAVHTQFILMSFAVLFGLLLASFGFSLVLLAKLRGFSCPQPSPTHQVASD